MAKTRVLITDKQLKVSDIASSLVGKEVEVLKKKSGAPYIVGEDSFVSVSHKKSFIVVGISEQKVGVDIELIEDKDSVFKIAHKYFGEKIKNKDFDAFYRSWTKKESLGKISEKGITRKLLSLNTSADVYSDNEGKTIFFNHFYFDNYIVTVADYKNEIEFILEKK